MQCPFCQAGLVDKAQRCPACKRDLEPYIRYLNIRQELQRLQRALQNAVDYVGGLEQEYSDLDRQLFPREDGSAKAATAASAASAANAARADGVKPPAAVTGKTGAWSKSPAGVWGTPVVPVAPVVADALTGPAAGAAASASAAPVAKPAGSEAKVVDALTPGPAAESPVKAEGGWSDVGTSPVTSDVPGGANAPAGASASREAGAASAAVTDSPAETGGGGQSETAKPGVAEISPAAGPVTGPVTRPATGAATASATGASASAFAAGVPGAVKPSAATGAAGSGSGSRPAAGTPELRATQREHLARLAQPGAMGAGAGAGRSEAVVRAERAEKADRDARIAARKPAEDNASELGFGQKWMLIAGIVITLLGLGYFLKYSFDQGWIPEWVRVAMAYAASIGTVVLGGWFASGKLKNFGLYLIGGGVGMLYASTYAAYGIYGFFNQPVAFGLMVLITAFSVYLALKFDTKWLAVLAQLGGFLTPVILASEVDNQVGLMTYMMILNVGLVWIAFFKQWTLLNYLGFVFTWLLFGAWVEHSYVPAKFALTMVFLNLFFLTHALAPYLYFFLKPTKAQLQGFAITLPNSLLAMGYSYRFIEGAGVDIRYAALCSLCYAVILFVMARMLKNRNEENHNPYALLVAQAGLFLVVTVPLFFSGNWITAAWAAMAACAVLGGVRLKHVLMYVGAVILWALTLGRLFLFDYPAVWQYDYRQLAFQVDYLAAWLPRWVTLGAVLTSLYMVPRFLRDAADENARKTGREFGQVVFALVLFVILNLEVLGGFKTAGEPVRQAALSVLWSASALAALWFGLRKKMVLAPAGALSLMVFAVIKLFLYDFTQTWQFELDKLGYRGGYAATALPRWTTLILVFGALIVMTRWLTRELAEGSAGRKLAHLMVGGALFVALNVEGAALFQGAGSAAQQAGLSVLWAGFATGLLWLGARRDNMLARILGVILYVFVTGKLFLYDLFFTWQFWPEQLGYRAGFGGMIGERFLTEGVVLGALAAAMFILPAGAKKTSVARVDKWLSRVAFGLVLFLVLTIETVAAFESAGWQAQTAAISVLWSLYAVGLMVVGFRYRLKAVRIVSIALLGLTALKVLLMDMSNVETPFRILSFVVLGVMLIGISYLYHRFADRLMGVMEEPKKPAEPEEWEQKPGWDERKQSADESERSADEHR